MKKYLVLILSIILVITLIACTENGGGEVTDGNGHESSDPAGDVTSGGDVTTDSDPGSGDETTYKEHEEPEPELDAQLDLSDVKTVTIDASVRHQVIESFGASGAWWAQYIGGNRKTRDQIAELLFDPVNGIGLNSYRYNIGGGSRNRGGKSPLITDPWRRAYSFEDSPGEYDWDNDRNAVWFMNKAVELGVDEVVMFVNSPLERLTKNGNAYGNTGYVCNIAPENYGEFAKYVLDVAEHFKSEGLPIKYVSPINEPAFEWAGGQEGCHYSDDEVIAVLKVFVEEIQKREGLRGVEISGPEGSSWRHSPSQWEDDTLSLCMKIAKDRTLGKYFTALDAHSYWSVTDAKETFKSMMSRVAPNMKLRQTEWCQMEWQTSTDKVGMASGLVIANVIHEDMTILDCVSWSFWTALSAGDYGDGLVYTDTSGNNVRSSKRMWSLGNYSRFIDRGYTRIDCTAERSMRNVSASAYEGINEYGEAETVIVLINNGSGEQNINFAGLDSSSYNRISVNVTDKKHDLEETYYAEYKDGTAITLPGESVVTVVISGRK